MDFIRRRRLSVFGHIARLTQGTLAHNALHCQVGLASGHSLGRDWRCRPGRPHACWTDQLHNDTGSVPGDRPSYGVMVERAGYAMTTTLLQRGSSQLSEVLTHSTQWHYFKLGRGLKTEELKLGQNFRFLFSKCAFWWNARQKVGRPSWLLLKTRVGACPSWFCH